jgi:GntR family transcriptional regulator/MocR family aminotransferase
MDELPAGWLPFDPAAGDLTAQIYRTLRERILTGALPSGARLPSTRSLAKTLGVARTTVVAAFEQLRAEGYLTATSGSATRVATLEIFRAARPPSVREDAAKATSEARGWFKPGVPDLSTFPHRVWARCLAGRARSLRLHDLGYGDRTGLPALREAILDHVAATRGVVASAEQVIILPSASTAIALIAKRLVSPHAGTVWIEDPGYEEARDVFLNAGANLVPMPVDAEGMNCTGDHPNPSVIYVTPSHQYPTGITMSLQRRLALIEIARAAGALIVEDDYDCEFLHGSPIAALQSIDREGVVAYVGTFSKSLAPGIRLAYAILPAPLVSEIAAQQRLFGAYVPIHIQAAMVDFMREGHFRAHVRRMSSVYRDKAQTLTATLEQRCSGVIRFGAPASGLQIACWFRDAETDDRRIVEILSKRGFEIEALSRFYLAASSPGLLIGLSGATDRASDVAETLLKWSLPNRLDH